MRSPGLTRAGWQVTVLERADAFSEVGAGIVREPNAVKSLDWLGLRDRVQAIILAYDAGHGLVRPARDRHPATRLTNPG